MTPTGTIAEAAAATSLREEILLKVRDFYHEAHGPKTFVPGSSAVPYAGRVFNEDELVTLVDSALDFWLTAGPYATQFESKFAKYFGLRSATLCNSGSSANLLAVSALTSPSLGDRQLKPGDEVITVAAGFPTTVNPILQNGLVPVFVDITIPTYNVDVRALEAARTGRTKAIVLAHTLGNPFDLEAVTAFARKYDLWLVEDCCDAVGAKFQGRMVGTFGDLATTSFYPAHHITMGEGGCVLTNKPAIKKLVESFRDWGRDCWCEPGKDNTCGKRYSQQLGDLPEGYDHKFTYSHIGYNLKVTDMQAAVGLAQLKKLPEFIEARKRNWGYLRAGLAGMEEHLILPEATPGSDPSWFGFPVCVRPEAPFTRNEMVKHLDRAKVATRLMFGGNLVRQPAYKGQNFRVAGSLENTDFVANQQFWLGVYPGLTRQHLNYMIDSVRGIVR
jgi:CDP-4-dehydro-6-deoxyglucose reductase, E1